MKMPHLAEEYYLMPYSSEAPQNRNWIMLTPLMSGNHHPKGHTHKPEPESGTKEP